MTKEEVPDPWVAGRESGGRRRELQGKGDHRVSNGIAPQHQFLHAQLKNIPDADSDIVNEWSLSSPRGPQAFKERTFCRGAGTL